ncbi:MAG: hypothetical protein KF842_06775 [Caulobacter sp.]|nr:hypothetical protein [Caulobacter sp.]
MANLDRDGDGAPGGSLPRRTPLVDLKTGVIVVAEAAVATARLADGSARRASARDLRIAGRSDLIS